jgi:hypothetical protein
MKVAAFVISCFLGSAIAAPAIVWSRNKEASESVVHSSKSVKASSLIASLVDGSTDDSSLAATIFLLGRAPDGSDSLSGLASSGALPLVAAKYEDATAVHSHVAGVESAYTVTRDAGANTGKRALEVSLSEFSSKVALIGRAPTKAELEVDENGMISKAAKHANLRDKAIAEANFLIVNIPASTDPSVIDEAVVRAVDHSSIGSVMLASVRSHDEVKHERVLISRRNTAAMMQHAGRRLEEQNNGDDADAADDTTGVYYVHMTPNIFAGIMFFFLFAFVTYTGVSCMGMIAGQDVYVSKMPTIGREA